MVSPSRLLAFAPVALLVIAMPGPSVLFTIGRALTVGRRSALLTVVGNGVGLAVQGLALAVGIGALLASVSGALAVLKVGGGLYLIWLGVQAIRHSHDDVDASAVAAAPRSTMADLRVGFVLGLTNPKSLVFLGALLPQFVSPHADPAPQLALLGAIFAVLAILGDSVWALAASAARGWFGRSPRRQARLQAGGGLMLVGLGAYSVVSGTKPA